MIALLTFFLAVSKPDDAAAIRTVMDGQVAAWNRGDLEGYMSGYWNSPELTFFSGDVITHGWQPTLDRYRKRYQAEGKEMGHLGFSEVTIDIIDATHATVRGRWKLTMSSGDTPHGLFTLLLRKFDGGWRIVHDHSS